MAKLIESKSKKPVRDVRAFEEDRCLTLKEVGVLEETLQREIKEALQRDPGADNAAWVRLRDAYAIRTILRCGLRRFEFLKIRCGDVDLDEGKLWVVGKGNIKDNVPLPDPAIETLRAWLEAKERFAGESVASSAFLFCVRMGVDEPMSFSTLRLHWKEILRKAGLDQKYGLHALRHTAGLIVFGRTRSIEETARFLRHTDIATTARHYLHVDAEKLRKELSDTNLWR